MPIIASRGFSDLVLASNPHIPADYFTFWTEEQLPSVRLRSMLGKLKGWVWLRIGSDSTHPNDVARFANDILPHVDAPINLITTDGDNSIPSNLSSDTAAKILSHPCVENWYTQNYDGSVVHHKLQGIPIGLDLHTGPHADLKLAQITHVAQQAPPFGLRKSTILFDATNESHPDRRLLASLAPSLPHVEVLAERLSFENAMAHYSRHKFVLSPRGNGLESHRTWELLFLGCVPIVKTGPLDSLYRDLPVAILQSWTDICNPKLVEQLVDQFQARTTLPPSFLDRSYWLDRR